jgi:uncharacterized protein (DUF362 family)
VKHPPAVDDRRRFLRLSLLGASALALGSTGARSGRARAASTRPPGSVPGQRHRLPDRPSPPERSRVAVVRTVGLPSHRESVRRAVELAGGLEFIRPGQTVLLKPAVNSSNPYPATTDPETVLTLAEMVAEAGGQACVADRTMFLRSTEEAFRATGIYDAARQASIPCRYLEDDGAESVAHPLAESWRGRTVGIYRSVLAADHIINLCSPRTHLFGDFTMAIKNNVGIVTSWSRLGMHLPWGLRERIAEIGLLVRPSLIVMDGREGFADGGPDSGDRVQPGFIAAGVDPVAIDAVGLAHLRLEGANPRITDGSIWELPTLKRAVAIGLGIGGEGGLELVGLDRDAQTALRAQMT